MSVMWVTQAGWDRFLQQVNKYIPLINQVNVHEITLSTKVDKGGELVDNIIEL